MSRWLLLPLLLAACQGDDDDAPSTADPTAESADTAVVDTGTPADAVCADAPRITWENFGAGFVTEACQSCHASTTPNRQGAPASVTFDSEEEALALADRILARVVDAGDMPPQGGITSDDRYLVEVWLRCP